MQTLILDNKILSLITFGLMPLQATTMETVLNQIASVQVYQTGSQTTQNQTQIVITFLRNIYFVYM